MLHVVVHAELLSVLKVCLMQLKNHSRPLLSKLAWMCLQLFWYICDLLTFGLLFQCKCEQHATTAKQRDTCNAEQQRTHWLQWPS